VRTLADGCLDIELGDGERHDEPYNPPRMLLCVPEGAFPFEPGDNLSVGETLHDGGLWLAIATPADNRRLDVFAGTQAAQLPGFHGQLMPLSCAGDRTVCGAYAWPAELQIVGKSPALLPGEERTLQIGRKSVRIYLGRAEQVIAAPATGCETDRAALGIRADVVVVEGEVEP
jgi:hypothetical protein